MKNLLLILTVLTLWPWLSSNAQLYPPNEAGVTFTSFHTLVKDVEASKKFWALFGGTPMKIDGVDVIKMPGSFIFQHPGEPSRSTQGTLMDHIGVNCQDCFHLIKRLVDAGYKTDRIDPKTMRSPNYRPDDPARAHTHTYSPDGVRIEIVENPCLFRNKYPFMGPSDPLDTCPERVHEGPKPSDPAGLIGTDLVHFYYASEPEAKRAREFYFTTFGARMIKYPGVNATVPGAVFTTAVSGEGLRPTNKGTALDGLGFEVKNLQRFVQRLQAVPGVKVLQPYSKTRYKSFAHAELLDPWGTSMQLTEGLNRYVSKVAKAAPPKTMAKLTGAANGKQIFETYCSYCHATTTNAIQYGDAPGLKDLFKWPPHKLRDGSEHKEHTDAVVRGVAVMGTDRTGGRMPPTGSYLSSQEMDEVMAYLKTL